jgi:hypothetical protein
MSEAHDFEWRQGRGEFARAFLKAANYSDFEIGLLGDLSLVSAAQVKELLTSKLEEMKAIEDVVRNPPSFRLLHEGDEKPK